MEAYLQGFKCAGPFGSSYHKSISPLPKLQIITPASSACFIGIDVFKLTLDVSLLDAQRKSYHIQVANDTKGFRLLEQWQIWRAGQITNPEEQGKTDCKSYDTASGLQIPNI
jgi:hypothetical protein